MSASPAPLQLQLQLLVQGETTMVVGGVPAIRINQPNASSLVTTINFLRCGCPFVQLVVCDGNRKTLENGLSDLQLADEEFVIAELPPSRVHGTPIFTVTRTISS